MFDVLVVGGGPAGLSTALVLGRCRRSVLLCDAGSPRNAVAPGVHGFLTRDGISPWELRRLGRDELRRYDVHIVDEDVTDARRAADGRFEVELAGGAVHRGRRLVLATGRRDVVPDLPGLGELYGRSVFHCPYCDGWEQRDTAIAAYACGADGADFAEALLSWSDDVALLTDGREVPPERRARLLALGVPIHDARVAELEASDGRLVAVRFEDGSRLPRASLFFHCGAVAGSELAARLGCGPMFDGAVETDRLQHGGVDGVYVVGDAARDVQAAIVAAGEGWKAAYDIHHALRLEDMEQRLMASLSGRSGA